MRRIALLLFLPVCLSLCSGTALANSVVTMHFIGTDGNQGGGYYTYPYYFSVSGSASMALICDRYDREITPGENLASHAIHQLPERHPTWIICWTAQRHSRLQSRGPDLRSHYDGLRECGWGQLRHLGNFSQNALNNPEYQSSGAGAIAANYLALAGTDPNSAYRGLLIYVPLAGSKGMAAQRFCNWFR